MRQLHPTILLSPSPRSVWRFLPKSRLTASSPSWLNLPPKVSPKSPRIRLRINFPLMSSTFTIKAAGSNLKEGHIPSLEFWVIDSEGCAGRIILGLTYIPTPECLGHHVGYATVALRYLLDEARERAIHHLMPTYGVTNIASRRVIARNGGVLLNTTSDREHPESELRFIIDLDSILDRLGIKAMIMNE